MTDLTMGAVESRFAALIWDNEPITAAELAKLADRELKWKKTTAYTALKRLCDKGIFRNGGGTVTSLLSREEYQARQSRKFLDEHCGGSIPAFLALGIVTAHSAASERDRTNTGQNINTLRSRYSS